MPDSTKPILKTVVFLIAGFAVNFSLTLFSAPGHPGTALAIGIFLTSFGMMLAKLSMEAVVIPIAITAFVWKLFRREKLTRSGKRKDKIELFARALFVSFYMILSALTGIYAGTLDGGMGWFTSSVFFGLAGLLLAMFLPDDLMWAVEGHDNVAAEATVTEKAEYRQALKDNESVIVFTEKVAKSVVNIVTTGSRTGENEK